MKRDAFTAEDAARDGWSKTLIVPRATGQQALATGTRVGEVEIAGVIGQGSAGVVYLAFDPSLERRVAVKEYMPSALASRSADGQVVVRSEALVPAFRNGLDGFIAEARLLARFDHPSLVKVYRVWEANGTAYFVMPYYEGPTVARMLAGRAEPPDEAALRGLLMPLLDALEVIHDGGQLHRDISADNILLTASGPVLLDFGATRRAIGNLPNAATVVLKRGYAPIEQYGESEALKPGPWTDLYALGSVLHFAITGQAPGISVERLWDDWLEPLSTVAQGCYGREFLAAVDAMLAVRPEQRPQDVASVRRLLEGGETSTSDGEVAADAAPVAAAFAPAWSDEPVVEPPEFKPTGTRRALVLALASAGLAIGLALAVRSMTASVEQAEVPRQPAAAPVARSADPEPATAVPSNEAVVPPRVALSALQATRRVGPAALSIRPVASKAPELALVEATPPAAAPAESAHWPTRCFDILQKASLENVSDEETAFLRQSCR